MNIESVMTREVSTCAREDMLDKAARIMWEHDCGTVPVVDAEGHVLGMLTDRDICMAAYTQGRPLHEIEVAMAASAFVVAARAFDSLETAGHLMQEHQVRRLPVVDDEGKLVGIVSMNDLARHVRIEGQQPDGLSAIALARTLALVSRPHGDGPPSSGVPRH